MPVIVEWHNTEKTIIRYDYVGRWTLAEFYPALAVGQDMIRQQPHTVDCIINLSQSEAFPANNMPATGLLVPMTPPNTGIAVAVGNPARARALANLFRRVSRSTEAVIPVQTIGEAEILIHRKQSQRTGYRQRAL
jgi:hypothetical protein